MLLARIQRRGHKIMILLVCHTVFFITSHWLRCMTARLFLATKDMAAGSEYGDGNNDFCVFLALQLGMARLFQSVHGTGIYLHLSSIAPLLYRILDLESDRLLIDSVMHLTMVLFLDHLCLRELLEPLEFT